MNTSYKIIMVGMGHLYFRGRYLISGCYIRVGAYRVAKSSKRIFDIMKGL